MFQSDFGLAIAVEAEIQGETAVLVITAVTDAMFYKLKAKYGGMDLSDAKRLKQLEDENAKLKRLVADVMLDNVVLKDLLGKP